MPRSTTAPSVHCQADPELWFSEEPADIERAKALCEECPLSVYTACRKEGFNHEFGVFGGLSATDRVRIAPEKAGKLAKANAWAAQQADWALVRQQMIAMTLAGIPDVVICERLNKKPSHIRQMRDAARKAGLLPAWEGASSAA